ncbi:serine recombinase [Cohnella xylanilytica]|uniref:recombinase family protein n=1 Tax=Cohnella xylanilytica TaxID=557555 RepID=UPI001B00A679|nr:recombinase family protein [Cohnella xylanilytica]GIO13580.1 serine recombinase [Cohnella xylanilytica]
MARQELEDGEYWMYLRKSRADMEAEARGEGETLSKHRTALLRLAKEHNITITRIFFEVESGESIFHRPEMVKMLAAMETNPPKGVLVMDIDRLGRGDKIDQGIIERAFKESRTLIITPGEIYDMNQESGEFSVEVKSFLARLELKQTTKRLQGGRIRSVENDRNYIGTRPPYGYRILKDKEGRTLIPDPEQAPIVRLIFELYTHDDPAQRMGSNKIAYRLNQMPNARTYTGKPWEPSTVLNILKNAVYAGRIQWKKKEQKKSKTPGKKRDTRTRPRDEWIDVEGRHEPLVSPELFNKAQDLLKGKYHVPYNPANGVTNPLSGLIKCGKCGMSMIYRPYTSQPAHLMCYNQLCSNKSSRFEYVERVLLTHLDEWLKRYKSEWSKRKPTDAAVKTDTVSLKEQAHKALVKELEELTAQKRNLHDLLERKIYDEETFLERSQDLASRIASKNIAIEEMKADIELEKKRQRAQHEVIPNVESALKLYRKSKDPAEKNAALKSVMQYAVYEKEKWQRNDEFTLSIFPRLSR